MDEPFKEFYQATFNLQKEVNGKLKAAKEAIDDINEELIRMQGRKILSSLTINKRNDYEILLSLFGICVLVKAEVPLPATEIRIATYLENLNDEKPYEKLENVALFLYVTGNQVYTKIDNTEYDIYGATNMLIKSLIEELKKRGTTVANKPILPADSLHKAAST